MSDGYKYGVYMDLYEDTRREADHYRKKYFQEVMSQLEDYIGEPDFMFLMHHIILKEMQEQIVEIEESHLDFDGDISSFYEVLSFYSTSAEYDAFLKSRDKEINF